MTSPFRQEADAVIHAALRRVMPEKAVRLALQNTDFPGRVILISVGKAAWNMANAARGVLGSRIKDGLVITKYGHGKGSIPGIDCMEAGHPVPDEASVRAAQTALEKVRGLSETDTVLFLLSGGGSALFELPLIGLDELKQITSHLLRSGADIVEMNTIRKRLSAVKGGKFAAACAPARVTSVILSDIIGDPVDMIASGPTAPDHSTCEEALAIADKYHLPLSDAARACLLVETPKTVPNSELRITGSVRELCDAAASECRALGYEVTQLTDRLNCEAKEAGRFLGAIARSHGSPAKPLAWIAGGETVVSVTGKGLGGRNQEIALAAAEEISGMPNAALFSVGSDGTDGPTDAAGGFADGRTAGQLQAAGLSVASALRDNDAYHALQKTDGLIITGPTGTNVNDVSVLLVRPETSPLPPRIRKAQKEDLPRLLSIYEKARCYMRREGNMQQWSNGYPDGSLLEEDIAGGFLYLIETDLPHAVFTLIPGDDPTYRVIDGAWKDQSPYLTIHRIASDGTLKGVLHRAVSYAKQTLPHIRIDTHRDNQTMQHCVKKEGFAYCGIIYLKNGDPRLAYEWSDATED